jgi:hypothetical protein
MVFLMLRRSKPSPPKVKCSDCGFLSLITNADGSHVMASRLFRLEGYQGTDQKDVSSIPFCFVNAQDIHLEKLEAPGVTLIPAEAGAIGLYSISGSDGVDVTDVAVLANITRERECSMFMPWQPGFTPKEHREMLDRQWMMDREERRDRAQRKWNLTASLFVVVIGWALGILSALIFRLYTG